ncbi:unnamed protein product [Ranitomeya imitator]|uniref:Reverse transcriptase/retrotransposon-derived protein RNase H-like domain-containing protein n=1 Tax=Ranitomeya imitator TaxID=111125 RepID=A0ABN9KVC5_9NEOB|nr:unnamed protein product [Ranitomeya imitator]
MDPVKVQAIHDWTQPTSVKSLQKFLGFANFYRRFIANFSSVAKPLTDLTKKGADVVNWSSAAVDAFQELKRRFSSAPVLCQPDVSLPFQVEVDASEIGAGAVLSQRSSDGSGMKPCAFFSRKFSPAERNYDDVDSDFHCFFQVKIKLLRINKSITIKSVDKGWALVVMDTSQYYEEIISQLSDDNVYEKLLVNPTQRFKLELEELIDEALYSGMIDSKLVKYLKVEHPLVPILYTLPKIHKDLRRPPECLIVSGRGSMCNKVSIFLDRLLRKFAISAPSYVRDTSDFIKSLEGVQVIDSTWLVSFDVTSLYTSIEHARGLSVVGATLAGSDMASDCAWFALALLQFILRRNFFLFGDGYYLQRCGTAMGSNVAPTYANIYMAVLQGEHLYSSQFWCHVRGW